MIAALFFLSFQFLQEIPQKPKEEFDCKIDYEFKQRPVDDPNTVRLGESSRQHVARNSPTYLPYLVLNIRMIRLAEKKMRVRITNNLHDRQTFRKIEENEVLVLDLGFTDDMKDRVTASEYSLTFVDADRNPVDQIQIKIDEDGSFFINGEKRGKF